MAARVKVYYDPLDSGIDPDPYPVYQAVRDKAPHFCLQRGQGEAYAVNRADDVERVPPITGNNVCRQRANLELIIKKQA